MADSISSNDLYFSRIVAMIPQELYRHSEEDSAEAAGINPKYFKHRRIPLAADEKKVVSTLKRKEKYGVKGEQSEVEEQINFEHENGVEAFPFQDDESNLRSIDGDSVRPLSSEDLRERLQKRILGLKANRTSKKEDVVTESVGIKKTAVTKVVRTPLPHGVVQGQQQEVPISRPDNSYQIPLGEVSDDVEFSMVSNGRPAPSSSAVPGSKMKRLKRMLDVADKKRRRLDELKASGEDGKKRVKEEQWIDAMKSATGDKAIVDTSKLKKAIKRREKKKESSARKWKERLDNVEGEKEKRLQRRDDNISKRKKGGSGVKIADPSTKGAAPQKDAGDGDKGAKKSRGAGFEGKAAPGFLNKQKQGKQKGPTTSKT